MKRCPESYLTPETNGHHVSGVSVINLIGSQADTSTQGISLLAFYLSVCGGCVKAAKSHDQMVDRAMFGIITIS